MGNIRKPAGSPYMGWHGSWSSSQVDVGLLWFAPRADFELRGAWNRNSFQWKDQIRARFLEYLFIYFKVFRHSDPSLLDAAGSDYHPFSTRLSTPRMASPPTSPTHSDSSWYNGTMCSLTVSHSRLTKHCPQQFRQLSIWGITHDLVTLAPLPSLFLKLRRLWLTVSSSLCQEMFFTLLSFGTKVSSDLSKNVQTDGKLRNTVCLSPLWMLTIKMTHLRLRLVVIVFLKPYSSDLRLLSDKVGGRGTKRQT